MKKLILVLVIFLTGCTFEPEPVEINVDAAVEAYLEEHLDEIQVEATINIADMNDLMVELVEQVDKSVLLVGNVNGSDQVNGTGTAVVYKQIDDYYYAITNNHVVEDSSSLRVYFANHLYEEAELVGTDTETDIAVIRFKTDKEVSISTFGDPDELKRGQIVIALGSPGGITYFNSATYGIISGVNRYIGIDDTDGDGIDDVFVKMLQHDAAINPGNSGGPLFNIKGEIIGINTIKLVSDDIEGMGFSIPNDVTLRAVEDLEVYGVVKRTVMGIFVGDVRYYEFAPEGIDLGAVISEVIPGGPTELTSDLQADDVIVEFGGVMIEGLYHLKDVLYQYHPGDEVEIVYWRDGEYFTTSVILGEK